MKATHIISLLKLNLAGSNPALFFLMMFIRLPRIQRAARFISRSSFFSALNWKSPDGKRRVRTILFIFSILSLLIFKLILHLAATPGYVNQNLLNSLFYIYCFFGVVYWATVFLALAKPLADMIKSSSPNGDRFENKTEFEDPQFIDRYIKPYIRPPLQNSDC
jgi:hypothetical protein